MPMFAQGTVKSVDAEQVILHVAGTNYELQLGLSGSRALAIGEDLRGVIRAKALKVWTTSGGGSFIVPLFGPPRVIQGRVKAIDGKYIIVQAGTLIHIELPENKTAYDLKHGAVVAGAMVNITTDGGASFEPA
jgi:hypothetical protein